MQFWIATSFENLKHTFSVLMYLKVSMILKMYVNVECFFCKIQLSIKNTHCQNTGA